MSNTNLKEYLPICYNEIVEVEAEQDALSIEMDNVNNTFEEAMADQFIQTCSLKAIGYYEQTFHIIANPLTESLEFRRERVLSRMKSLRPPYTYWYLRKLLDGFFGVGGYTLDVNNNDYEITLESSAQNSQWYHEIQVSITIIKPCNMVFINKPRITNNLITNETIKSIATTRNYKLNGIWKLGQKPFITIGQEDTRKMSNVESIRQHFIDTSLEAWEDFFHSALINSTTSITNLNISVENSNLIITYEVTRSVTSTITNIKLRDSEDIPLIESNVYIPIDESVIIKHIIKLEEGVND